MNQNLHQRKAFEDAVQHGDVEEARRLVGLGVYPGREHTDAPLGVAAAHGDEMMVQTLLELGADPEEYDYHGRNAMHYAIEQRHLAVARLLLAHGNASRRKARALDALHKAAQAGDAQLTLWLLRTGVDPNAADEDGQTALGHAVFGYSFLTPEQQTEGCDTVRALIRHGADVNARYYDGIGGPDAPLIYQAAQTGAKDYADLLREAGATVTLAEAALVGYADIARVLLAQGVDPDSRDSYRNMPALAAASMMGHTQTVCLLLEAGADPCAKSGRKD